MVPGSLAVTPRALGTVVVADDDPSVLRITSMMLERAGYRVLTATDGMEALGAIETYGADVAVCDVRMPRFDGPWLVAEMRLRKMSTPVVLVTGLNELDASLTLGPGVAAYLMKPFSSSDLQSAVSLAREHAQSACHGEAERPCPCL